MQRRRIIKLKLPIINKNFTYLLSGQFVTGLGDTIFLLLVPIILVDYYKADAQILLLFTLVETIPEIFSFLIGPAIDRIKHRVRVMVFLEVLQLLCALAFTLVFYYMLSIYYLLALSLCFALINEFAGSNAYTLFPRLVSADERKDALRIQMLSEEIISIGVRLLSSIILAIFSIMSLLFFNVITFVISTLLFARITVHPLLKSQRDAQQSSDVDAMSVDKNISENIETDISEQQSIRTIIREYGSELYEGWKHFWSVKSFAFLLLFDGILGSVFVLFSTVVPLYLTTIGIDLRFYGTFIVIILFSRMIGVYISKYLTFNYVYICIINYILSAINFAVLLFVPNLWIKLFFYMLDWMFIGASNVIYDQTLYAFYKEEYLGRIRTLTYSILAFLMPITTILAMYINDISIIMWANMLVSVFFAILCIVGLKYFLRHNKSTHNDISDETSNDTDDT